MIEVFDPGLEYYVKRIESNQPYTFVRMGDGEWSAILQDRDRTSSRSQVLNIPALRKAMARVVIQCPDSDDFILSMRPGSQRPGIGEWLAASAPSHIRWHDCRVLYKASKKGELYPWVRAIKESALPVIIVGPERHATLDGRMFDISTHVVIPNRDCFAQMDKIMLKILSVQHPAIVLFSAGPAAKVMCHQLHQRIGGRSFLLDVGSLLDPYCKPPKISRRYHKGLVHTPGLIRKNLTGE